MSSAFRSWLRASLVLILLASTLGLLRARVREEVLPPHIPLKEFPLTLGGWLGRDLPMSDEVLEVLGPGDFLSRDYVNASQQHSASLFIAFFPSQRRGDTIHSPKNCLPGAGWIPVDSARIWIDNLSGQKIEINRYVIEKGSDQAIVLYWYQAHGHVTPSEYKAKYHLVADSIAMNRSDGALVRILTFRQHGETLSQGEARAVSFAQLTMPLLETYIPR
jgi:EpsI family protein